MNIVDIKKEKKKIIYIPLLAFALFMLFVSFEDFFGSYYLPYKENHTSLHIIMEACSITVSIVIALHGWLNFSQSFSRNRLLFAGGFLAVAWFDSMHVLTYNGMPFFIEESSAVHAIYFWAYARITEAIILSILVFSNDKLYKGKIYRERIFSFFIVFSLILTIFTFLFLTNDTLLYKNMQPTFVKDLLEYVTAAIHLAVIVKTYFTLRKQPKTSEIYILLASCFLIFTALLLTIYTDVHGFLNIIAHFYKLAGYFYLFRAIYVLQIEKPYRELDQLNTKHELLLNGVADGILGTDQKGNIVFVNDSACEMLGYIQENMIGMSLTSILEHGRSSSYNERFLEGHNRRMNNAVFVCKEGKLNVEYETQPLFEENKIEGMMITFRDISAKLKTLQLEEERKAYETELELASKVQQSLLPSTTNITASLDIGVVSIPLKKLNGDFYELASHENQISFAVADVMGKGIPAAIQMTMIKHSMSHFIAVQNEPSELLRILNKTLTETNNLNDFITMSMMKYNKDTSTLSYCSAGHEPALFYRAAKNEFIELTTGNPALGLFNKANYETKQLSVEKGDCVLLFSDGLIEARNNLELDLTQQLKQWFLNLEASLSSQQKAEIIVEKARQSMNGTFSDDASLLIVKF